MKKTSNTTTILIVAIGLFVIVATVAIIVRFYEIGGTKKAPLFAGELEEKIDYLSTNNLREYAGKVGIEYAASTYLRNLSCEIGPYFRVESLQFSIDSLISQENIRLFRYNRSEAKTVIENLPQNLAVISVNDAALPAEKSEEGNSTEAEVEEGKRITVEQFCDALRFYLPTHGREGPKQIIRLELKVFQAREELLSFVEETGVKIYSRQDGQYQFLSAEEAGYVFLYESVSGEEGHSTGKLYELEYY